MESSSSRPNLKRSFQEDDDSEKQRAKKKVRFPKGKKVKPENVAGGENPEDDDIPNDSVIAQHAAKARKKHRNQIPAEFLSEEYGVNLKDISAAEVAYEDDENFVDDGIQIEPFNLNKEREEGYFDAQGNFVEYVKENEIKDAWLDNVEVEPKYAGKKPAATSGEDIPELSSAEVGKMKRRIANVLEQGETVLQALRRLKGSGDRKAKMSVETKHVFDQLTEDAMKLMENGEYNVYHEKREVFEREAEGYEKLAQVRGELTSLHSSEGNTIFSGKKHLFSDDLNSEMSASVPPSTASDISNSLLPTREASGNEAGAFDMFAEGDEQANAKPSDESNAAFGQNVNTVGNPSTVSEDGALENDYVYEESSGYYYSSSLGYYYDPSSGLYCSAASGQWYSFNEETGTYNAAHE